MHKIILGLLTTLVATYSWSMCTYNFDATHVQLSSKGEVAFPINYGQKVGYSIKPTSGVEGYVAASSKLLHSSSIINGDHAISDSGIIAFEYNLKLPKFVLGGKEALMTLPVSAVGTNNSEQVLSIFIGYLNNMAAQEGNHATAVSIGEDFNEYFPITSTVNGYQRYGFYINQTTKKIGLVVNGIDKGYVGSYFTVPQSLYFMVGSAYLNIANNSQALNQDIFIELVTDKTKLQFTYPTGTKDICGNVI